MNWKNFFAAAKGKEVVLIAPGIYGTDDPLHLADECYEVTEDAVIWTGNDGDVRWLRLDAIVQGKMVTPSTEDE